MLVRTARAGSARAALLAEAAIYVPAIDGMQRARLEAAAAGAAIVEPPGLRDQPELAGAAVARFAEQPDVRARKAEEARAWAAPQSFEALGAELDAVYQELASRRRPARRTGRRSRIATGSSPTSISTPRGRATAASRRPTSWRLRTRPSWERSR